MFGNHLKEVRNLMEIYRYQGKTLHCRRSVAEHSWFVSKVAHGLASWEKYKFGNGDVDVEKVMFLAINHDIVESYTGDIISTTKTLSETFRKGLTMVEQAVFEDKILTTLPKSWGDDYMMVHDEMLELESVDAKIVKSGDLIDRVFECMDEIKMGNKEPFEEIIRLDLRRLYEMNLMSVHYFLKYSLKDINAESYLPSEIKVYLDNIDFSAYF